MSDTKTADPQTKQLSEADKQQARETATRDNLEAEQAEAAKQAEIKDLNERYNAPAYTPPAQESEPQQEQQGPDMGDTPMGSNEPEDQDQSNSKRKSAERAKNWRESYEGHKERLGKKKAEKKAARAAKRTEKGLQKGKKGLEASGKTARAGGNVTRVGAAGEGAAGAGEAAGAAGTAGSAAGGVGTAGAGGAAIGGTAAGGAATGAVAGGTAAGTAAAAEGGVMAAGAASAPETLGIGLAVAAAIAATIEVVRHPKKWAMRAVYIGLALFGFVAFFIMLTGDPASGANGEDNENDSANSLVITKTALPQVNNGDKITYTITVNAQNAYGEVTVTDPIPQETTFDSATGIVKCEGNTPCTASSRTVTWKSKDNNLTPPFTKSFTITVLPRVTDRYITNIASGELSGFDISGDAKSLARQILANPKINLSTSAKQDIQSVIDGKPITYCSSENPARFSPVTVHPELLKTIVYLGQRHSFDVWNILTGHACDQFYHPKGRAMDIGNADGKGSWQNASFRQDAADILPAGGTLLQTSCPGTPPVIPRRKLIQGADGCTHQHIDVGIDIP